MSALITTEQLNQIAKVLGTTDKNVVFSAVLQMLVKEFGLQMNEAFGALFGEGAYSKFAGDMYNALRAQA